MYSTIIELKNPLPPFYLIPEYLWGKNSDYDSDGDSQNIESTDWSELTIILRSDLEQRIDIDPMDNSNKKFIVKSDQEGLIEKVIYFLQNHGSI